MDGKTPSSFVHLHVHTHYSLLDGANKVPDLVKRTKALGMDAIAITDHGCMFGVIEFFNECKKEGIKPILGMEAYMAPGDRRERSTPGGNAGEAAYHLLLLAENLEGYKNLIKLSSLAYKEGFYYKPRIDKEILRQYSKGLIGTSACLGGEVCSAFLKRDAKNARKVAETYAEIFGPDRFFIEVQKQGIKEQDMVNPELADVAQKLGLGLVATNDVHFLNKEDHFAHDVLCCISMGRLVTDEGRLKYPEHLYLKSPQEMAEALGSFDGAIENTRRIAGMCNVDFDFKQRYAPVYRVPKEKLSGMGASPMRADEEHGRGAHATNDDERYLRRLCEEGLDWRYGTRDVSPEIRTRLDHELKIICMKNFCSYFLIVWDFCNFARENGIPVGARGSGVGTMVGYLLGLCNVDPIKYGLLFERFMDPSRNEMPDIDIDICQDGRGRIIDYVRNKYGHVAQIITFGTLAAKAACKDVGRVLGVPLSEVDKLTKLIPGTPGMTLDKAMSQVPDLRELYGANPTIKQVIDIAKRLEGLCRNAGMHAAGVIIADQPLDDIIPLYKSGDDILTQFEGPIAEKVGLLKMDFLGLRTLSTLQRSIDLVKRTKNIDIDIEKVDLTDQKVFDLFKRGETKGIFQFESGGMQDLLMKMQPDRIEDLIAANALYRPGPMELIPLYCNRKHGREKVPEVHPMMDKILAETYGIMCIHEDTLVSMADGTSKAIKFIRRGDRVHSLNYSTSEFELKDCHGCGPTRRCDGVRITLENGLTVMLTEDHNVYTFDGMKEAGTLDPAHDLVATARVLLGEEKTDRMRRGLRPPHPPEFSASPIPGMLTSEGRALYSARPPAVRLADGRSGRTPALPYPPGGTGQSSTAVVIDATESAIDVIDPMPVTADAENSGGLGAEPPGCVSAPLDRRPVDVGHVSYVPIAKIERVYDQQFYGMSVADHHNLLANGIVVKNCYQEQVMQVFNQLGGIELSNAYKLIKAISKKTVDVIAKFKPDFIKGTMSKGVSKDKAEEIFDLILKFGGYGFNKSHSSRYAIVAFQTAYMKVYHPVEYMAALLTYEMGDTTKMVEYIEECRRMTLLDGSKGIKVLPPDVNVSDKDFTPIHVQQEEGTKGRRHGGTKGKEGVIRFGLCAVRGVGEKAVEAVIEQREKAGKYSSLYEFCERVDLRQVQRSTIEALIKCGAFSSITEKRAPLLHVLEKAVEMGQQRQNDLRSGQMNFFSAPPAASASASRAMGDALPDVEELPSGDLLKFEKELLGFYITSHPLTEHQMALEHYSTATTRETQHLSEGVEVTIGGMITRVKKSVIKNGRNAGAQMANITLEDLEGQIDATIWSDQFADLAKRYPNILSNENIVFVRGKIDRRRETPCIILSEMIPIEEAMAKLTTAVAVKVDRMRHSPDQVTQLAPVLKGHKGHLRVYLQVETLESQKVLLQLGKDLSVRPSKQFIDDIEQVLGSGSVQLRGDGSRRLRRLEQQRLFKEESTSAADETTISVTSTSTDQAVAVMDAEMDVQE